MRFYFLLIALSFLFYTCKKKGIEATGRIIVQQNSGGYCVYFIESNSMIKYRAYHVGEKYQVDSIEVKICYKLVEPRIELAICAPPDGTNNYIEVISIKKR